MLEKFILVKAVLESFRRFKKYLGGSGLEYIHFTGFKTISYAILAGVNSKNAYHGQMLLKDADYDNILFI